MVPYYLQEKFSYNENQSYDLRSANGNQMYLPKPKTDFLKKTFLYSGSQIWNRLPLEIKKCTSLLLFKKMCFKFFLDNEK